MSRTRTQIGPVSYNAAEQAFEARVTVHFDNGKATLPARFPAPVDTDFATASAGLSAAALRQMARGPKLSMAPRRDAARPGALRPRNDAASWLQRILNRAA